MRCESNVITMSFPLSLMFILLVRNSTGFNSSTQIMRLPLLKITSKQLCYASITTFWGLHQPQEYEKFQVQQTSSRGNLPQATHRPKLAQLLTSDQKQRDIIYIIAVFAQLYVKCVSGIIFANASFPYAWVVSPLRLIKAESRHESFLQGVNNVFNFLLRRRHATNISQYIKRKFHCP